MTRVAVARLAAKAEPHLLHAGPPTPSRSAARISSTSAAMLCVLSSTPMARPRMPLLLLCSVSPWLGGAADDHLLAGEGAAGEDEKLEKLQQEFDELRTELAELKKRTKRTDKAMAKERSAGDQIAAWFNPKARDMGDEDMAAFFAALMQMKDAVSDGANQVLLEAMHAHMSRMAEVAPPPPPPQIFGGNTFEFGSSSGTANDGMEFQFLGPPPQEQGFEARMDMQQMVMAPLPPSHVVAAGMDVQDMPPPPGLAAGMDLEQMQMTMPKPPGFDAGLDKEIDQWLDVMLPRPEFTAGMETVQQGLHQPNAGFPY
uniref:Uncharacterized protein n=1 Tax=Triticum aestivum TaxID=4565 RepID=A0A080YUH4_WHEAT|nr:unnamed protein product [Triticum aestivum]